MCTYFFDYFNEPEQSNLVEFNKMGENEKLMSKIQNGQIWTNNDN